MLFLNQADIFAIPEESVQSAVERAYRLFLSKDFHMPDRIHVGHRENTLLLMPCFSGKYFATKLVSVFPNAHQHNLPAVNGMLVLCDNNSGNPLAVMDAAALTAQRTGAVGGLAVKHLTDDAITTAGIFGAGIQGYFQARYLLFNRRVTHLLIKDQNEQQAGKMAARLEKEFNGLSCKVVTDSDMMIERSQLIISATTSTTPVFDINDPDRMPDTFIGIGSFRPDMQEFPDIVTRKADRIFVDTLFALEESGDLAIPLKENRIEKSKVDPFASVLEAPSAADYGMVFFKSVGMALFDLVVAAMMYETSCKQNSGQILEK